LQHEGSRLDQLDEVIRDLSDTKEDGDTEENVAIIQQLNLKKKYFQLGGSYTFV
jgi:hypothetical protein